MGSTAAEGRAVSFQLERDGTRAVELLSRNVAHKSIKVGCRHALLCHGPPVLVSGRQTAVPNGAHIQFAAQTAACMRALNNRRLRKCSPVLTTEEHNEDKASTTARSASLPQQLQVVASRLRDSMGRHVFAGGLCHQPLLNAHRYTFEPIQYSCSWLQPHLCNVRAQAALTEAGSSSSDRRITWRLVCQQHRTPLCK